MDGLFGMFEQNDSAELHPSNLFTVSVKSTWKNACDPIKKTLSLDKEGSNLSLSGDRLRGGSTTNNRE